MAPSHRYSAIMSCSTWPLPPKQWHGQQLQKSDPKVPPVHSLPAGPTHILTVKIHLQMVLTRFEGIPDYLNEAKQQVEQHSIAKHFNNKVTWLPFTCKLVDSKWWLHWQDVVTRLMFSKGRVVQKKRSLLLFNNMVLCASLKHKSKKGEVESSRDFQVCEGDSYSCKWFSLLSTPL